MQTPPAIVPEWYLLPFYAILRSIPNKLLGVIAMLSAILILLAMPFTDLSRSRGIQFRPLSKIAFYIFIANFLILMVLGAKHVESPYIEFGQISTVIYFAHFLIIVPFISLLENSLVELAVSVDANRSSLNHRSYNKTVSLLGGVSIPSFNKIGSRGFHTTSVLLATKRELEDAWAKADRDIRDHDASTQPLFDRLRSADCSDEEANRIDGWIEEASHQRIALEDKREAIYERIEALDKANVESEENIPE